MVVRKKEARLGEQTEFYASINCELKKVKRTHFTIHYNCWVKEIFATKLCGLRNQPLDAFGF